MTSNSKPGQSVVLEQWLPYKIFVVLDVISRELARTYEAKFNLTIGGWRIIAHLTQESPLTPKQLAQLTGLDQVRITRLVDPLVREGYLRRRENPKDRRSIQISLTQKGTGVYDAMAPVLLDVEDRLMSPLTPEERELFKTLFFKVADNIKSEFPRCP